MKVEVLMAWPRRFESMSLELPVGATLAFAGRVGEFGEVAIDGRLAPSIDDVLDLAEPILKHRMALTFSARAEGETVTGIIARLKSRIG